jgi:NADPH:quinone reductase-like Zn-dependent oxidoreductase
LIFAQSFNVVGEITVPAKLSRARQNAIPTSMKAAAIDRFGPPSVITRHTLPVPKPGPREILIALHAAGVGIWDESIRDGSWKPAGRTKFPLVLGTDGAGIVAAVGVRVKRFRVGDRVWAYDAAAGFYGEYAAVGEREAGRVPRRLDLRQAGAGAVTGLTALQGIDDALKVRRGETVLIFGGSGAVGTLAIQFATRHGARVIATASGRDAVALVRRLGASAVIDARNRDAAARLRDLTREAGIDALLALAGGDQLERCLDFVRDTGRVAYPNGIEPEPKPRRRVRITSYDAVAGPRQFAELERAANQARLRVPIAAEYPLASASTAHRRLHGHVVGRIVLRIRRD